MSYTRQGFYDGMVLKHTHLLNMEDALLASSSSKEDLYAADYGILPNETVDMTKFNAMLEDAASGHKNMRFNDGVYTFPSHITVSSNTGFIGNAHTIFKLAADSSSNVLFNMKSVTNVTLASLYIDGGLTAQPVGSHVQDETLFDKQGAGNRYGIYMNKCRRIKLHDLDIYGWDMAGAYCIDNDGGAGEFGRFYHMIQLTNTSFYYNYYGLWLGQYGEYNQINCCTFGDNYIGVLNQGGNNQYTGCMFNNNWCGFALHGTDIVNESHGGCYASTYNHNSITGLGGGIAIYAKDSTVGWNFDGQNIWYGAVILQDCKGILFNNTVCGNMTLKSTRTDGAKNMNMMTNTYFHSNAAGALSGNDGSVYIGAYLPNGLPSE